MMQPSTTKNRSEQLIYQRRQQENYVSNLSTKLRQENYEKTFANWENKGKQIQQQKYTQQRQDKCIFSFFYRRLQEMRMQATQQLQERKAKLSVLLAEEHDSYKQEILNKVETPEQVKQRMIQQVQELKQKKEEERKGFVDKQLDRRFKNNADELRQVEGKFNELQAVAYRNMQMMEKQKLLEDQYSEEMIYAELYRRDILRKEREEKAKEQAIKEKQEERNKIVGFQQQLNDNKKYQETTQVQAEKQMLKEEWGKEDQRHKEIQQQYQAYKNNVQKEIIMNNEEQREMKMRQKQLEKQQDKEMIEQVLAREQAIARMEQAVKEKQKEETKQFLLNFKNRASEFNSNDAERDRLIEEENRRQWERKEKVWADEDEARIKLMYQVYDQRAKNVEIKQGKKNEETNEKVKEKEEMEKLLEQYERDIQERKRIEQEKILQTKSNLLHQMGEKQDRHSKLKDQLKSEEEALQKEREDYQRKIENEKAKGRQLLDELRKQRPY